MEYQPTIGLEIHIELKTQTKMFCNCLNDSDEKHPNINICSVCTAQPGTLPVINKKAVEAVLKVGLALNSELSVESKFDRKNYFYPDLPKGYQISQYDKPLCLGGYLEIPVYKDDSGTPKFKKIRIRRIHLEEDTARLVHPLTTGHRQAASSLVDFNRAGIPLMELVTEPDLRSAQETKEFAKQLQLILRYLEVSETNMEKGQMRVEANISLSNGLAKSLGTKVEIKNLNSFRAVERAIEYEIERQKEVLKSGKKIIQETRGWNDNKDETISQRIKEEAHDYRYFPEPDLPVLTLDAFDTETLKRSLPELPQQKINRLQQEYFLDYDSARILAEDPNSAEYFEKAVSEAIARGATKDNKRLISLVFNYFTSDLIGLLNAENISIKDIKMPPEKFADLIVLLEKGGISSRTAKDILIKMYKTEIDPHQLIKYLGLEKVGENLVNQVVEKIIAENTKAVTDYKKGKENALQFLIGKAMGELKGTTDPEELKEKFKDKIKS